jgi:hypothetical protein
MMFLSANKSGDMAKQSTLIGRIGWKTWCRAHLLDVLKKGLKDKDAVEGFAKFPSPDISALRITADLEKVIIAVEFENATTLEK